MKKALGGFKGMFLQTIFENLHSVVVILVLFEHFYANFV